MNNTLIDDGKTITVAYRTMINYNIKELKYHYYLERLDSITPVDGDTADGNTKKMFFVDTPKEYEELKILSFDRKKDYVIINEAQLDTKVGKIIFKNGQLDLLSINESSLFPEIDHVSKYITTKYS